MTNKLPAAAAGLALGLLVGAAHAQSIGGNVSLAVTGTTANIQAPGNLAAYPYVSLEYALGATTEIFFNLGKDDTAAAVAPSLPGTQGSPALPANGICLPLGPNSYIAAITATSTSTLRVTQLTSCPQR